MENTISLSVVKGATSKRIQLFIGDSTVTTGAGRTSLAFNTASLVAYYIRDGGTAPVQIPLVTATVGTWTSGGFKEISSTLMPGYYELGIPDACLATGANSCDILIQGSVNTRPTQIRIQLTATDQQDGASGGMTNIAAIKLKTDLIVSGSVTVATPVSLDGSTVTLIQWDDYKAADSRAVSFTSTNWPASLATATSIVLRVAGLLDFAFTASSATVVTRDFTAVETGSLTSGQYDFQLVATLLNGDVVTLAQGRQADDPDAGFIIAPHIPSA